LNTFIRPFNIWLVSILQKSNNSKALSTGGFLFENEKKAGKK